MIDSRLLQFLAHTNLYQGEIPLVINVHSADHIGTLLELKKEVESSTGRPIRLTLTGASEAHLLAQELGEAGVGVILNPVRPFSTTWDQLRMYEHPIPPFKATHSGFVLLLDCRALHCQMKVRL